MFTKLFLKSCVWNDPCFQMFIVNPDYLCNVQLIGPWGIGLQSQISKFQTHSNNKYLKYFLWNCYQVNVTTPHWSLVQVMAWCHQATSHYLSLCWPRSLSPYDVTRPQWIKMFQLHLGAYLVPSLCEFSPIKPWHVNDLGHNQKQHDILVQHHLTSLCSLDMEMEWYCIISK